MKHFLLAAFRPSEYSARRSDDRYARTLEAFRDHALPELINEGLTRSWPTSEHDYRFETPCAGYRLVVTMDSTRGTHAPWPHPPRVEILYRAASLGAVTFSPEGEPLLDLSHKQTLSVFLDALSLVTDEIHCATL